MRNYNYYYNYNYNSEALISTYYCHYSESFFKYIFIFIFTLLKPADRAGETWEPSNILMPCLLPSLKASLTASLLIIIIIIIIIRNCVRL